MSGRRCGDLGERCKRSQRQTENSCFKHRASVFSQAYLNGIALRLNQRPRKTLAFETPANRLQLVLH